MPQMPVDEGKRSSLPARLVAATSVAGLLVALLWFAEFGARPLAMSDVFWQVRTGDLILEKGAIPGSDPFSYTVPGAAWNNHEWGAELLVSLLHRATGWGGVRLATALLSVALATGLAASGSQRPRHGGRCSPQPWRSGATSPPRA